MSYTGGEGDFPKYNNTNIGFLLFLRFSVCKHTTKLARLWTGLALIHNLLEYLLVTHRIHKNNLDTM